MLERIIERLLYASRWLLAPVYLSLALALIAVGIKFFQEVYHLLLYTWTITEADMVLKVLSLVDLVLVASLVVMVMFSGYENFVSRIDLDEGDERLGWLGKLDAGTLKLKLAASIVAISSIHLLKVFVDIPHADSTQLMWYVIIHLTFVVSALMMGFLERIAFAAHRDSHDEDKSH